METGNQREQAGCFTVAVIGVIDAAGHSVICTLSDRMHGNRPLQS
jgi:hypothetical protein